MCIDELLELPDCQQCVAISVFAIALGIVNSSIAAAHFKWTTDLSCQSFEGKRAYLSLYLKAPPHIRMHITK